MDNLDATDWTDRDSADILLDLARENGEQLSRVAMRLESTPGQDSVVAKVYAAIHGTLICAEEARIRGEKPPAGPVLQATLRLVRARIAGFIDYCRDDQLSQLLPDIDRDCSVLFELAQRVAAERGADV